MCSERQETIEVNIIYEDNDIIVVEKPAGVPVQTKNIVRMDLVNGLKNHLREKNGVSDPYLGIIHRLDQPVRGILVFALNKEAAGALSRQLNKEGFNKRYHAVVEGTVDTGGKPITLESFLVKDKDIARISDGNDKNAKKAVLKYRSVRTDKANNMTLLDIELITGRFHQIRAQLSGTGHPIVNDVKYGGKRTDPAVFQGYFEIPEGTGVSKMPVNERSICLSAYSLSFIHPADGKKREYSIEEPAFY